MGYTKEYADKNRELINEKRRNKYSSARRKEEYNEKRCAILEKGRSDRAQCPLCGLDFRRLYIPKHIATRHKKNTEPVCHPIKMTTQPQPPLAESQ